MQAFAKRQWNTWWGEISNFRDRMEPADAQCHRQLTKANADNDFYNNNKNDCVVWAQDRFIYAHRSYVIIFIARQD